MRKMCILELTSKMLGVADLHYLNIITVLLEPCITDAEVFLNPIYIQSGIFNLESGAAVVFDPMHVQDEKLKGQNRIWFNFALPSDIQKNFQYRMSTEDLARIDVHIDKIMETTHLQPKTIAKIKNAHQILQRENGRFVLQGTASLQGMQPHLDHRNSYSIDRFMQSMQANAEEEHFQLNENCIEMVRAGVIEDARNHDTPEYYYNSRDGTILYHGVVMASSRDPVPH